MVPAGLVGALWETSSDPEVRAELERNIDPAVLQACLRVYCTGIEEQPGSGRNGTLDVL